MGSECPHWLAIISAEANDRPGTSGLRGNYISKGAVRVRILLRSHQNKPSGDAAAVYRRGRKSVAMIETASTVCVQ